MTNPRRMRKDNMVNAIIDARLKRGESIPESEIHKLFRLPYDSVAVLYNKIVGQMEGTDMVFWDVMLDGQVIDSVQFSASTNAEDVRRALIEFYSFDPRVKVRRSARDGRPSEESQRPSSLPVMNPEDDFSKIPFASELMEDEEKDLDKYTRLAHYYGTDTTAGRQLEKIAQAEGHHRDIINVMKSKGMIYNPSRGWALRYKWAKDRINEKIGYLINNKYLDYVPLDIIFSYIKEEGYVPLQEDMTEWSGVVSHHSGKIHVLLGDANSVRMEYGEPVYKPLNASLFLSWYEMPESGKYEVVAYVS